MKHRQFSAETMSPMVRCCSDFFLNPNEIYFSTDFEITCPPTSKFPSHTPLPALHQPPPQHKYYSRPPLSPAYRHAFANEGKGIYEWWVGRDGNGRVRVECPSPQKPNGKGKGKAVDSDVEMLDEKRIRRGRSRETKSSSFLRFI
jgi:hypothetical protein